MSLWATVWSSAMGLAFSEATELESGASLARRSNFTLPEVSPGSLTLTEPGGWTAHVGMRRLDDGQWETLVRTIASDPQLTGAVIVGELPNDLHGRSVALGCSLAPDPRDVAADCTCGDWRDPCRHVGALVSLVAELIADDPWLFTMLRGRTREELVGGVRKVRAAQRGVALPETSDEPRGSDPGVLASGAFRASPSPLPPSLAPLRRPGTRVEFRAPPVDAGVRMADLDRLIVDAAERAHLVLNGAGDAAALLLEPEHDLARLAARVIDDNARLDELAASSGHSGDELRRRAHAWLIGGARGVAMACSTTELTQVRSEVLARGISALEVLPGTIRRGGHTLTVGQTQLRIDPDGQWWRFASDDRLGWTLAAGPSRDPSELLG